MQLASLHVPDAQVAIPVEGEEPPAIARDRAALERCPRRQDAEFLPDLQVVNNRPHFFAHDENRVAQRVRLDARFSSEISPLIP